MATPQESYMTLWGGTDNGNSIIYTADDTATQNLIQVGDNIKISGTAKNNGIFTVTDITTDGTTLGDDGGDKKLGCSCHSEKIRPLGTALSLGSSAENAN